MYFISNHKQARISMLCFQKRTMLYLNCITICLVTQQKRKNKSPFRSQSLPMQKMKLLQATFFLESCHFLFLFLKEAFWLMLHHFSVVLAIHEKAKNIVSTTIFLPKTYFSIETHFSKEAPHFVDDFCI